ncbi:hypothetical protein FIBSPDRAFT_1046867 [Athelia psychrophila]|uniref:BTB domain-containing protein n=1 Tax=Athelia psychrophila TaxID=1759441 RepID=A0A166G0C1_9AGAM|nr:hypothetical protein FIBSPDRAFT_1046867 [Fibularhizoctonia sp. CBS 109695]
MSSPTSTTFDFMDSESSGMLPSRSPSVNSEKAHALTGLTLSRHYVQDTIAVFKVEDHLFRINRAPLDEETDMIPRGEGPIELASIKPGDFEILLDFLNLGTRHDKKPLTVVDWASVITVSSIYGMQRVLNLACKSVMDQQKTLLDQQNTPPKVSCAGAGFERDTYGMYFLIREKGTAHYLHTWCSLNTEGTQVQIWKRANEPSAVLKSMVFFLDSAGALCHAASGLAVDIVDDVPVLRRRRPVSGRPNPWSRPLPEFSFVNSQIRVKFSSDPSMPSCSDDLYPKDSWATKNFVLALRSEKDFHAHPIADFSPWIPATVAGSFQYETRGNHEKNWRVLVEERIEDVGGARTSWEVVSANKV